MEIANVNGQEVGDRTEVADDLVNLRRKSQINTRSWQIMIVLRIINVSFKYILYINIFKSQTLYRRLDNSENNIQYNIIVSNEEHSLEKWKIILRTKNVFFFIYVFVFMQFELLFHNNKINTKSLVWILVI